MLDRISDLMQRQVDFAFETTLSTKSYVQLINRARANGYYVTLIFFWLNSSDLAVERVKLRVLSGGHDIPIDVIHRRYQAGLVNLNKLYRSIVDYWMIFDNSERPERFVADGYGNSDVTIHIDDIYAKIDSYGK